MDIVDTLVAAGFSAVFSASFFASGVFGRVGAETVRTFGEHAANVTIPAKTNHLFPLNSSRWFRTDVIYYPVDTFYVVDDLV